MSDDTEIVFLGINDAGMRVYNWLCDRNGVFVRSLLTTREQLSSVRETQPEFVVSCGYSHIVPDDILSIPSGGCLNLHPGYLPYNRGANPNVWSIVDDTPAGATLHYMDESLDTGDIVARKGVSTDFADTGKSLHQRLEDAQVELFKQHWPEIEAGEESVTAQPEEGTYHRTDDFEELCELNPDEEMRVEELLNRLRALTFPPYDNAFIELEGERFYVDVEIERAE
ncbi:MULTISPECIES: formyltransferase family protein [Halolamina]|uniref:Formyl transferase n=1 Tax=Halolamina pelagica TaxID=699431 RepID=A0A1I5QY48_9EURY|nr:MULTISPECIES: formyltransferase family protein [Halolamina]NHX35603.1 formyl transferase [Halolamina sp. R1-12]SFP51172.1 Formyl transferase [Halolamina pelagica]